MQLIDPEIALFAFFSIKKLLVEITTTMTSADSVINFKNMGIFRNFRRLRPDLRSIPVGEPRFLTLRSSSVRLSVICFRLRIEVLTGIETSSCSILIFHAEFVCLMNYKQNLMSVQF